MEYFILELNENYTSCWPEGAIGKIDSRTIKEKKFHEIPRFMIFPLKKPAEEFTDLIMAPCFMVSKTMKEVLELYDPFIVYTRVLLYNKTRGKSQSYFIPYLEEVDCLTEESQFNLDRSVIKHAALDGDRLKEKAIVRVKNVNCTCILIRMDLAESLLWRNLVGIGLRETDISYQADQKIHVKEKWTGRIL